MEQERANGLFIVLIGVLAVVVVVQSVIMAKHYGRAEEPRQAEAKAPPVAVSVPPGNPATPLGGFGVDPGTWDPFSEFRSMRQQIDQMFNDSFGRFRTAPDFQALWGNTAFSPSMDLVEEGGNYVARMDIPGADKSDISVNITDRVLEVSGTVDETIEEKGGQQLRKERRSGRFSRKITLPGAVKADEMEAEYKDGVLVVTIPKAQGEGDSRTIEVK